MVFVLECWRPVRKLLFSLLGADLRQAEVAEAKLRGAMEGSDAAALEEAIGEGERLGLPDEAGTGRKSETALEGLRRVKGGTGCQVLLEAYDAMPRVGSPAKSMSRCWKSSGLVRHAALNPKP